MKKLNLILNFTLIVITLCSCDVLFRKKIDCIEFNKELLKWTPYSQYDTIHFIDNTNKNYSFIINNIWLYHPPYYYTDNDCGNCDDFWGLDMIDNFDSISIHISYDSHNQVIQDEYYSIHNVDSFLILKENLLINYQDSIIIRGQTIKDIKIITSQTNLDNKFILRKNYGLIMIKFNNLELYNTSKLPVVDISIESFNYTEVNCL